MRRIDADELKKNFQDELCYGIACAECSMQAGGFCRVERWIDIAPTIDAEPTKHYNTESYKMAVTDFPPVEYAPIKHGRNLNADYPSLFECSVCGYVNDDTYSGCPHIFTYCPNCGAKMDERK